MQSGRICGRDNGRSDGFRDEICGSDRSGVENKVSRFLWTLPSGVVVSRAITFSGHGTPKFSFT
jgi:hypothetical protein